MQKKLTLFTADYPYGTGETFLETEITYLAEGFDEVVIVSQNLVDAQIRQVPANCKLVRLNLSVSTADKLLSLTGLLHPVFWKEIRIVKNIYAKSLSKGILSTMLISLFRAKRVKNFIAKQLKNTPAETQQYFYSYWCDDVALGLAMAQKKYPNIKTLCRIHRWDVYFEESAFGYLPFRHSITKNIGKIVSISQDGIDYAKAVWKTGLDEQFILSRLGISNSIAPAIRERDYCLLVSCSNIIPVKRVHLIAHALSEIKDIAIKWVHFGDGSERLGLENTIKNLPSNIIVELMGRKENKDIYTYYTEKRPDLFINVSSSEGVPVSIMEAMSFGIPVIATDAGGNNEIVTNENGELLPLGISASELAEKIKQFIELDQDQKETVQRKSFETWREHYNSEQNYNDFVLRIHQV